MLGTRASSSLDVDAGVRHLAAVRDQHFGHVLEPVVERERQLVLALLDSRVEQQPTDTGVIDCGIAKIRGAVDRRAERVAAMLVSGREIRAALYQRSRELELSAHRGV